MWFEILKAVRMIISDQAGEWGIINDNWTGNGIIGAIAERRADVGVGSLLTWASVYRFLGFTSAIRKVGITCIAPKPRYVINEPNMRMKIIIILYGTV